MRKVRVLVAEKSPVIRLRVRTLAEGRGDVEVVGEARSGQEALIVAPAVSPDIVLVNVASIPGVGWLDFVEVLAQESPTIRAVLSMVRDDTDQLSSLLETAVAVMQQPASKDRLTIDIPLKRSAGQRGGQLPGKVGDRQLSEQAEHAIGRGSLLSPREHEVLLLLAEGFSNREVAERIFRSVKTVETYRASIKRKLGLQNRAEIVRYVRTAGPLNRTLS